MKINASLFTGSQIRLSVALFIIVLVMSAAGCQPQIQPEPVNGAPGIGDPYYPGLGNGGYDVQKYTITLDVDPATNTVSGSTTISALATERLAEFNLDFQGLTVDSVTVNAKTADFAQKDPELTITPSSPLDLQRKFSVVVGYHGNPRPVDSAAIRIPVGWERAENGSINVFGEPDGASTWYPNNNHPRDKAAYRFEITVPKPWVVAATGTLKQAQDLGEKTGYVWEMNQPMASYLASISIGKYTLVTAKGPNGVTIRSYFPPDYSEISQEHFDILPDMMKYLNSLYGDYPFDEYGVVIADEKSPLCAGFGQALEAQTLSLYCPSQRMAEKKTIIHELAHQWFGDDVSLENWKDIWLKEGMATYAEWLWVNRSKSLPLVTKFVEKKVEGYRPVTPIGQPPADNLYVADVYKGGALVFHALRLKVGDKTFFKILRTYLSRYHGGNAGTDEFIAIAEEISGQDLKAFFDSWLYSVEIPSLTP